MHLVGFIVRVITRDEGKRTWTLIDVAISEDRNVIKEASQNILQLKNLTAEIQRMWNVKTKVIQAMAGTTGAISKSFTKYLSNVPESTKSKNYRKTAKLLTAHTLREVQM